MTVDQAIANARRTGVDRLDAQLLLAHRLGRPRSWVIAHGDAVLPAADAAAFAADCARRADNWPLAYLVGEREFHGLPLKITPAVLVPRPDTETLVDWALDRLAAAADGTPFDVLDLGTGSGAIALALARSRPGIRVTATDADPDALAVARDNAARLDLAVEFAPGSWWSAVPAGRRFHLAVSNPPYVADGDPHLHALRHEPRHALCAGIDGLASIRELVAGAPRHLLAGAWLLLEHGVDQAPAVAGLLDREGFVEVSTRRDVEGRPRCTGGRLPDFTAC